MLGALFVVLFGVGLALLGLILWTQPQELMLLTLPSIMTAVGAMLGGIFVHNLLGRRAIPEVVLELETPFLHLDDHFDFNARFRPKTDIEINVVNVTFQCVERAFYRAGTRSRTYTKVVYTEQKTLGERLRCRSDQEITFSSFFHTPPEGMCTFIGTNNSIIWSLHVHVDIARWPDVKEDFQVRVLPVLGERPAGA